MLSAARINGFSNRFTDVQDGGQVRAEFLRLRCLVMKYVDTAALQELPVALKFCQWDGRLECCINRECLCEAEEHGVSLVA